LTETRARSCGEVAASIGCSRGGRANSETSSISRHADPTAEAYRQLTTARGGMSETLPNSYRQMAGSAGSISQTPPDALGQMASSQAGSLSDRSEAFAGTCGEGAEPSSHA
jgi:hypothetical protein